MLHFPEGKLKRARTFLSYEGTTSAESSRGTGESEEIEENQGKKAKNQEKETSDQKKERSDDQGDEVQNQGDEVQNKGVEMQNQGDEVENKESRDRDVREDLTSGIDLKVDPPIP